jgi:hypothetical protein
MNFEIIIPILIFLFSFQVFCFYISPYTNKEPSKVKRIFALTWIYTRRLFCSIGFVFLIYCVFLVWQSPKDLSVLFRFGVSLTILPMGLVILWVGAIGRLRRFSTHKEDINNYKAVRKKYNVR